MRMVIDAEFTATRVATLREDAALDLSDKGALDGESYTFLTPLAEQHYDAALALLEQARAQFMMADFWAARRE